MNIIDSVLQSQFKPLNAKQAGQGSIISLSTEQQDKESPLDTGARFMVDYIRQSARLSNTDKQQLIGLAAMVDELAGDDKGALFEAISSIVMMMEMVRSTREEWQEYMTSGEAMDYYWQTRKRFAGDEDMRLSLGAALQAALAEQEQALTL